MNKRGKMAKTLRIPNHIGIIPDGNRRWAVSNELNKQDGYAHGIQPGVVLFNTLKDYGVKEMTFYGFTKDNVRRPKEQTQKYVEACILAVEEVAKLDSQILVVGNTSSSVFPKELLKYTKERVICGKGSVKVNFLINYDWNSDLSYALKSDMNSKNMIDNIMSKEISRMELIIRWGGHRRLSGFLPVQSVYSDFYIVDDLWPNFKKQHIDDALNWYKTLDVTLGG